MSKHLLKYLLMLWSGSYRPVFGPLWANYALWAN